MTVNLACMHTAVGVNWLFFGSACSRHELPETLANSSPPVWPGFLLVVRRDLH
jgi:hypothetical protein